MFFLTRSLIDSLRAAGCVFAEQEAELLFEAATSPQDLSLRLARNIRLSRVFTLLLLQFRLPLREPHLQSREQQGDDRHDGRNERDPLRRVHAAEG